MKKVVILSALLSLCFLSALQAQSRDTLLKREIGIRLYGFDDFDFIYKKQKAENKYSRIRLVSANFSVSDFDNFRSSVSLGLAYGREKRIPINNNFSFIRGWEVSGRVNSTVANRSRLTFTPGIGMVLGFQYDFNKKFAMNIETIPTLSTDILFNSNGVEVRNLNFGFNSNSIALGMMYRF